jgi:hypothetical protein
VLGNDAREGIVTTAGCEADNRLYRLAAIEVSDGLLVEAWLG